MISNNVSRTRVWIVHAILKLQYTLKESFYSLDEVVSLALALPKVHVVGSEIVKLSRLKPDTFFGKGVTIRLGDVLKAQNIGLLIVNSHLSPVQQRNLEKQFSVKILDRTALILEIFSDRAQTREGVLQVEIAALSYQRSRLVRAWTHLERQRGGLGFVGGPGETQVESDKRAIDKRLFQLKKQLGNVVKTRRLHRASRAKVPYPIIALVGYTNVGKSTIFNKLTGENVFSDDMLFATLDPCMRATGLPTGMNIILSDTVGFITDLPTELVAAFRATLEEVRNADLIIHVRDLSSKSFSKHFDEVNAILNKIEVPGDIPIIEIWNKSDLLGSEHFSKIKNEAARKKNVLIFSAETNLGFDLLLNKIEKLLKSNHLEEKIFLPHQEGFRRAWLYQQGVVKGERISEKGISMYLSWNQEQKGKFYNI